MRFLELFYAVVDDDFVQVTATEIHVAPCGLDVYHSIGDGQN